MKYFLLTLGCQMNISDSERVVAILNDMGMSLADNEEEASLVGIIACSVRQKAIDKVYSRISKWNRLKQHKPLLTFVTGCILPADQEKFLKLFDFVFLMSEVKDFPDMIRQYGVISPVILSAMPEQKESINSFWKITPQYNSKFEAFIPIQNGCDKFCTFCAVPYTRGREISRPSGEILEEVETLVDAGYKSITLLGQNVNSYGFDKKGDEISFSALLRRIGDFGMKSGKDFWVYFTSPHPRDMTHEVIDVIATYPVLARQIHLPLQSGDDRMLIRMNRKHKVEEYRQIVQYIRRKLPGTTLFTDIITGFTGETEAEFQNTLKAVSEFKYNMAFIATYSPRPGAVSSRWKDDIPLQVKKQRLHLLNAEVEKHSFDYNRNLVGQTIPVLITGKDRKEGFLTGLTEGKINVRVESGKDLLTGSFVNVKITGVSGFSVAGEAAVFASSLAEVK